MALGSMTMAQLGLAVSIGLIDHIGVDGAAWLRLVWAALIFVIVARPRPSSFTKAGVKTCVILGIVTGLITILFMAAIDRIPLGTASAIEFLGPLVVAVTHGKAKPTWPVLAAIGVLLLTRPWEGSIDALGVGYALAAAVCWGAYIVLTQKMGDQVEGMNGLAVSMPVAALVASVLTGPGIVTELTPRLLLAGLGIALLMPVLPIALEFLALRRLTTGAFGTLMALEPAIALLIGFVLLSQAPHWLGIIGMVMVVTAGVFAARSGERQPAPIDAP